MLDTQLQRLSLEADRVESPIVMSRDGRMERLRWSTPAGDPVGFGTIDRQVHVPRVLNPTGAVLAVPYDRAAVAHLDEASLRLFRIDAVPPRRRIVGLTERHAKLPVLLGPVEADTVYGVVGLPTDPGIRATIEIVCQLRKLALDLPRQARNGLRNRICELVLCNPELSGTSPGPGGQPLPGGACERCRGIDFDDFLECELVAAIEVGPICPPPPWDSLGPDTISGAIRQLVIDPNDRRRLYAVSANGGLWRLDDVDRYPTTSTWRPLTDRLTHLRFRTLTVAPGHPGVLYAANVVKRLHARPAETIDVRSEIWRSRDAGSTWQPIHGDGSGVVHRLAVDPRNPDRLLAATSTGLWERSGPGAWRQCSPTHVTDVVIDPGDPDIVYAAALSSGVLRSVDGGLTWETPQLIRRTASAGGRPVGRLALGVRNLDGTPQTAATRTVVARMGNQLRIRTAGSLSNVIVPFIGPQPDGDNEALDHMYGGRPKRSDLDPPLNSEWINCVAVDPFDPAHIIVGSVGLIATRDGGVSWRKLADDPPHEDYHAVAFDPEIHDLVYVCNDGGVFSSVDGGTTWPTMAESHIVGAGAGVGRNLARGLVTAEFRSAVIGGPRRVGAIDHTGLILAGSPPDDWQLWSRHQSGGGTTGGHENSVLLRCPVSDDRFYVCRDDDGITLAEAVVQTTGNVIDRAVLRQIPGAAVYMPQFVDPIYFPDTIVHLDHRPAPVAVRAVAAGQERLFVFGAPSATDPLVPGRLRTFRLPRDGVNGVNGLPPEITDVFTHPAAFADVTFQPGDPDRLFALADDGTLVEADVADLAGTAAVQDRWEFPDIDRFAGRLVPAPGPRAVLYALSQHAIGRWRDGSRWRTQTVWPDLDESLLSLVVHPLNPELLFVGTSRGVYASEDTGISWTPFRTGLPSVPVTDLAFDGGELLAATLGRGAWRCRNLVG